MKANSQCTAVCVAAAFALSAAAGPAYGQEERSSGISVGGTASVGFDLYDLKSTPDGSTSARRPTSLLRVMLNPTISLSDEVSLPFSFIITVPETSTIQSQPASPGFGDFLQNPANSFSLSPKFGWAGFTVGTHTPQLSELSGGDLQIFGAGVDLTPGKFRLVASAGNAARSIDADTLRQMPGEYARQAYMGKLAYVDDQTEFGLNVVRILDDATSIPTLFSPLVLHPDEGNPLFADTVATRHRLMPLPEESVTATFNVRAPIAEGFRFRGEVGGSLFTRDMTAEEIPDPIGALESVITQRQSTRADIAGLVGIDFIRDSWGIALNSTYIGAGYHTLAYPWMQADRLDVTVAPRLRMLDDRISLNGSFGWRQNNLSQTEEATTSQLLGSFNADARIGEALAVNGQYSNYGLRTPVRNDTLRVETVAQSISLTPTLTLASEAMTHMITASAGIDDYTDYNPITGTEGSNRTRSVMGMYALSLGAIPLTADISGSWLLNRLSIGDLTITSVSVGAGYRLFEDAVTLGANGTLTQTAFAGESPDKGTTLRLFGSVRISDALRLRVDASTTSHRYGDARPGASFDENFLRSSLQWSW